MLCSCLRYRIGFVGETTARDVSEEMFQHPSEGDLESLFHQALETLEETDYCSFEVGPCSVVRSSSLLVGWLVA